MPPCSPGPTSARRTCVAPDFVVQGWTPLTSVMPGLVVRSWSERRCAVPILRGAYLRLARLDGADLSAANLDGVGGLTQGQIDRAHLNSGTKLPEGVIGVEDA